MKKILVLIFCLCALGLFAICARAAAVGDVDGNGKIEAADARLALRAAVGLEPAVTPGTEAFSAADADRSGDLTAADARLILRRAVWLEELDEPLSTEELVRLVYGATVGFSKMYPDGEHGYGTGGSGYAIGDEGAVLTSYDALHLLSGFKSASPDDLKVQAILAADPELRFAMFQATGSFTGLRICETGYSLGDEVYFPLGRNIVHTATICEIPEGIVSGFPFTPICIDASYTPRVGTPLLDRYGRVIGLIAATFYKGAGHPYAFAVPISVILEAGVSPRSFEEFTRDEWSVKNACPVKEITVLQHGVAAIPLTVEKEVIRSLSVRYEETDSFRIRTESPDDESVVLLLIAGRPCTDVPVTVHIEGFFETEDTELRITVAEDGYVNMVGLPYLPDPGVIWELGPASCRLGEKDLELVYKKEETELSAEEMFYAYADVLLEMGYTYEGSTIESEFLVRYMFRLPDADMTLTYYDMEETVTILFRVNDRPDHARIIT